MDLSEILTQLDKATDANFVATLAGLSLAAVAFFIPSSDKILANAKNEKEKLEERIERGKQVGIMGETAHTEKVTELNSIIKSITDANSGLLKAFVIFSWFLVYTITIDQVFDNETALELFPTQGSLLVQFSDTVFSYLFLSIAGYHLWQGISGIKKYYNISFDEERKKAIEFLKGYKKRN